MDTHTEVTEASGTSPNSAIRTQAPGEALSLAVYEPKPAAKHEQPRVRYFVYALVIVIAGATAGYVVANRGPTIHGARSELYYQLTTQLPTGFLRQDRSISTQLVALASRDVLAPVAAANHMSIQKLTDEVKVSNVDSSEILRVEVDDPSRARALRLAGAITTEYLRRVPPDPTAQAERYLNQQIATTTARESALATRIAVLQNQRQSTVPAGATPPPPSTEELQDQAQLQSLVDERSALQSRLDAVTVQGLQQPVIERLNAPYLLSAPVSPRPLRGAIAGGLLGALIAAVALGLLVRHRAAPSHAERTRGRVSQTWM